MLGLSLFMIVVNFRGKWNPGQTSRSEVHDLLTSAWHKRLHRSCVCPNFTPELFPLLAIVLFALGNLAIIPLKRMEIILVCTRVPPNPKYRACCGP